MRVQIASDDVYFTSPANWKGSPTWVDPNGPLLLFSDKASSSETLKGFISEGVADLNGDRPCLHLKLDGDLNIFPDQYFTSSSWNNSIVPKGPTYVTTKTTLYDSDKNRMSFTGPVYLNQIPMNYTFRPPDFISDSAEISYKDVIFMFFHYHGNTWRNKYTALYRLKNQETWWPHDYVRDIEFDIPNKKFRYVDQGPWYSFMKLRNSDNATPDYSLFNIPQDSSGLLNVFDRLDRMYNIPPVGLVYGDLVRRCANDATVVQTNSIELIHEVATIATTLKGIANIATGGLNAGNIASGYLSYKYGLRLTLKDLKSIGVSLSHRIAATRDGKSFTRAREVINVNPKFGNLSPLMITYNYKITYWNHTNDWRDGLRHWFDSGLFPSLTNAWDLIPLSFVFDWFTKFESYLSAIDANTYWSTYGILGACYSEKQTFTDVIWLFQRPGYTLSGNVKAIRYDRQCSPIVHKPTFFEQTPRDFKNYAEITSLFVAGLQQK